MAQERDKIDDAAPAFRRLTQQTDTGSLSVQGTGSRPVANFARTLRTTTLTKAL